MPTDSEHRELREIIATRSFKTGSFTLASGRTSTLYFNLKPTMMHPRGGELAARALLEIAQGLDVDHVSGLEIGAIPTIGAMAALSSMTGQPIGTSFVRKAPKDHGTRARVEGLADGETLAGHKVLAIDDVATSGGSILQAVEAVRAGGGTVEHAACIVDREEGGAELLRASGVTLHAVFHACEFVG